jgi:hypothetical protein
VGSASRAGTAVFVSASEITRSRVPVGLTCLNMRMPGRPQGDRYSHLPSGGTGGGLGGNGSGGGTGDGGAGLGGNGLSGI